MTGLAGCKKGELMFKLSGTRKDAKKTLKKRTEFRKSLDKKK